MQALKIKMRARVIYDKFTRDLQFKLEMMRDD